MADLRMLQEQSQLLQNLLGSVTEALKAVNTASTSRPRRRARHSRIRSW